MRLKKSQRKLVSLLSVLFLILTMVPMQFVFAADYSAYPNLLSNPSFESSLTGWSSEGGVTATSVSTPVQDGSKAVLLANRTQSYSSLSQDITTALNTNGPGDYYVECYAQMADADATATGIIKFQITVGGTTYYVGTTWYGFAGNGAFPAGYSPVSVALDNSGYKAIACLMPLYWPAGTVTRAVVQFETTAASTPVYIDNMSLKFVKSQNVKEIVSATAPADVNAVKGTAFTDIPLPSAVSITLSDSSTITVPVTWDAGSYDKDTTGTYALTGTLGLNPFVNNTANVTASINVNVVSGGDIKSVETLQDITVAIGTVFGSIGLPEIVNVALDNNSNATLPVTWDPGSYNKDAAGTYMLTGALTLPGDNSITNTGNLTASIIVKLVSMPVNNTYYFSTSGDDNNTGAIDSPKKTLVDAQALMVPGNTILFKRGDAWYSPNAGLNLTDIAGTAQNQVVVGAYGNASDPKPVIAVMSSVNSGWTDEGGNVWSHLLVDNSLDVHRLFINEQSKAMTLSLAGVDADHFYVDMTAQKVYIHSTSAPVKVEYIPRFDTTRDPNTWTNTSRIIEAQNISYFTFKDIEFKGGSNWNAVQISAPSSYVTFDNCTLQELNKYGICFLGGSDSTAVNVSPVVKNCSITKTWSAAENSTTASNAGDGVLFQTAVDGGLVQNCKIFDMGHCGVNMYGSDLNSFGVKNCILELCEIYSPINNYLHAFSLQGYDGKSMNNIVRRNYFHDLTVTSHIMGNNNKVYSNVFVNHDISPVAKGGGASAQGEAMDLMPWMDPAGPEACHDNIIANNTVIDCEMSPIDISGNYVGNNNIIVNNAFVQWAAGFNAISIQSVQVPIQVENNGVWNGSAIDSVFKINSAAKTADQANSSFAGFSGNLQADPKFVDQADRNFHLTIDSPFRTGGKDISALIGAGFVDYDGKTWDPQVPSIGAFQFTKPLAVASVSQFAGTASSDPNLVADKAIDGDISTLWEGTTNYGYMTYDLGDLKNIGSMSMSWQQNGQMFDILVSNDDVTYTDVFSGQIPYNSALSNGINTFNVNTTARYIRLIPNGFLNSPWYMWCTVRKWTIMDQDGNAITPVGGIDSSGSTTSYENLLDDDDNTTWAASADYATLKLDMGSSQPVESLNVAFDSKTFFNVYTSSDDTTYTQVFEGSSLDSGTQNIPISKSVRYIKIEGRSNENLAEFNKVAISEVQVMGYRDPLALEQCFQISVPVVKNIAGETITSLVPGSLVTVEASIKNVAFDPLSATFIVALYDANDSLVFISFSKKQFAVHETETLGAGFNLPSDVTGYHIRVFVWDGIQNGYHPLSGVVTFP